MRAFRPGLISLAVLSALSQPAPAQDVPVREAPPQLAVVEGDAMLEREDGVERATPGTPLFDGDRVVTSRGRVEILFPDGTVLDIDEASRVESVAPAYLRVTAGRVALFVAGARDPAAAARFQIDTPAASARTMMPGEYRISVVGGLSYSQTELAVLRGSAALSSDRTSVPLRTGERSAVREHMDPSYPQGFNSARVDAFDRWIADRRQERMASRGAPYLPSELDSYGGALDQAGSWDYLAPYGYVWYPNVAGDWRPYTEGYWSSHAGYGWMWVGASAWSWPTHHYGRWGHAGARWYWVPGRTFAPAWVSWGGAPGYVGWCPLGVDNRPVFAASSWSRHTWTGWTVMPRDHFGAHGHAVRDHALRPGALPRNTPFITQTTAPPGPRSHVSQRFSITGSGSSRNERAQSGRGAAAPLTGAVPAAGSMRASDRRWEVRPPTAVPRTEQRGGVRESWTGAGRQAPSSGRQWQNDSAVNFWSTRGNERSPRGNGPSIGGSGALMPGNERPSGPAVPRTTLTPKTAGTSDRPRYSSVYRRSDVTVPPQPVAPGTAPMTRGTRQPSSAASSVDRGTPGVAPFRQGRAERGAPPARTSPPGSAAPGARPSGSGDGVRPSRPSGGGDHGGASGARAAAPRGSGSGHGSRRPR